MSTENCGHDDFLTRIQEIIYSKEIWEFIRDQMMLGGYKYEAF